MGGGGICVLVLAWCFSEGGLQEGERVKQLWGRRMFLAGETQVQGPEAAGHLECGREQEEPT